LSTYYPKAFTGLGTLPDTIRDRSISIRLKRTRREPVQKFREREAIEYLTPIRERIEAFVPPLINELTHARPVPASGLNDRAEDSWEPLLAIADVVGDARARYNLGIAYATGTGVAQDSAEAVRWFRLAADQGPAAYYRCLTQELNALARIGSRPDLSGVSSGEIAGIAVNRGLPLNDRFTFLSTKPTGRRRSDGREGHEPEDPTRYLVKVFVQHRNIRVLLGRHWLRSSLLFNSLFDDASVASHDRPHHEAGHSPCVTLRTQDH